MHDAAVPDTTAMPLPLPILIVEDEAIVALDLKSELEGLGYSVVGIADTADDAVALARAHRPGLALMDIMLKGTGDGIVAAETLRGELGVPVIFLTSYSDAETVQRAARAGAYGYLTKPFQLKELRAGIEVAVWKVRMERQLREADRWFALTLRCVQDGIVVTGADGRIRFLNAAAEALTGWTLDDAAGQPADAVVRYAVADGEPAADPRNALKAALAGQRVVDVRHARRLVQRNGDVRCVDESAAPVHDEAGAPLGAVLVLRDAAERLQHEEMLRASERHFRAAFDFAPLGMALVSLDGRFLQVNHAFARLVGRTPDALLALRQADLSSGDELDHEAARLTLLRSRTQPVVQFEKHYRRPGGAAVPVLVSASLHEPTTAAAPAAYLYQVHDLSAQRAAAAQLAALADERMRREASDLAHRSKSEFLSRVSHEMRTPLNAVLGFAGLLKQQSYQAPPSVGAYSQYILDAGEHLLALVDDVLDLQRASDGTLRLDSARVELGELVHTSVNLLGPQARTRDVRLELALAPGLAVTADPVRLRQVLLNLGSNAIKYNVTGGQARFSADALDDRRVRLQVEDTGIGMSQEQLAHLYEPFNRLGRERTPVPGVGLGLVITRRLVEQMGGSMRFEPADAGGTRVTIELPRATD